MTTHSGEHLLQLELGTLAEVPDSHAWSTLHERPYGDDPVPVVDLRAPDAVRLIGRACAEWGAFQITGHGVPVDLTDRAEAQARRLFALPAEQKLKAARRPGSFVNGGYGVANLSVFFSKRFWSEGFSVRGSPLYHARLLWPDDYAEFSDTMEEYNSVMRDLARMLMRSLLLSLGLSEEDIDSTGGLGRDEVSVTLQLNHYPPCPDPDRAIGLAEHTDSGFLTILHQGSVSGLQLLHAKGDVARWITVPPIPGALVVNLGDLAEIISNGRFRSVVHRAVVNRSQNRDSVAYFCGPPDDFKIAPIGKLVGSNRRPAYRAVTLPEFVKLKEKLYLKTLESLRLPEQEPGDDDNA